MKLIAAAVVCASCLSESTSVNDAVNDGDEGNAMLQAIKLRLPVDADGETEAQSSDMYDYEAKEAAVSLDSKGETSVDVEATEDALEGLYGGSYGQNRFGGYAAGTALEYYRLWNQGWLSAKKDSSLAGDVAMMELQELGSEEAATVFQSHSQNCQPDTVPELEFHESNKDEDGVQHFLFRAGTKFQYLAFQSKRLIHADPDICSMNLLQEGAEPASGEDETDDGETSLTVDPPDQMVSDCEALFRQVTQQVCNRTMTFRITAAAEGVADGIVVDTTVEVNGQYVHRIMCDYEVPWTPDVQLLQHVRGANATVLNQSLVPVMVVQDGTELCELDQKNGVSALELEEFVLSEQHSMGELSLYRGYEHLALEGTEPMPPLSSSMLAMQAPSSIDHRTAYSHCFLKTGAENMRNQGRCGSCWAFAAASATMADLCISNRGNGAFASSSDRYEVSVAQIMSCNSARRGCNGGNAGSAGSAWGNRGITKERDAKYACGGGDPSKHFDVPSTACKSHPWGQSCAKTNQPMANWNFAGTKYVRGEAAMRDWVGRGHSMYFRFDTYRNIFSYRGAAAKNSVYKSSGGGSRIGGHAVTLIGYGRLGNDNYWLIQNSWGSSWGFGGYGRYKRGTNFGNCERYAYGFNAWVTGGTCPGRGHKKCTGDGSTWGARTGSVTTTGGGPPTKAPPTGPPTKAPPTGPPTTTKRGSYELKSSGRCSSYITTMAECSAAAKYLRLSDTSVSDDRQRGVTYDPPYCYFEGRSLKFNVNGKNRGSCTRYDQCLCKTGPQAPTTTAKRQASTTKQAPRATTTKKRVPANGTYAKGQMGSSQCPPGTQHIKSEADCQAASEQLRIDEFGFRRSEDEANWLQGCYALEGKGVYYNIHTRAFPGSGAKANPRSFPICTSIPR